MNTKAGLNSLDICLTTLEDLDVIANIESASFSEPWTRAMFEAEIKGNQFGHVFSAWVPLGDGLPSQLCGYVCFWVVFEEIRLMNLAVAPEYRRRGFGKTLVNVALHRGQSQGATRALLEVRASNLPAQKMYERLGFQEYGLRKQYYTNPSEDAILMRLEPIKDVDSCLQERGPIEEIRSKH